MKALKWGSKKVMDITPLPTPNDKNSSHEKTLGHKKFRELLSKTIQLKEFAVKNGYQVDPKTLQVLNQLDSQFDDEAELTATDRTKLDTVIEQLTAVTLPITIDSISDKPESDDYKDFKRLLIKLGGLSLILAILGFSLSAASAKWTWIPREDTDSILAIGLGLLGAVVYSLFNVLSVVPAQAFNPDDIYYNKARLFLGVLLGWLFYFAFAMKVYRKLPIIEAPKDVLILLVPFMAGYSTKFVVGVLERVIAALEITLGIEEKRDIGTKRLLSRRGS